MSEPRIPRYDPTTMTIPLHKHFVDWVVAACALGLSCPVGRAVYVMNRKRHTWPTVMVADRATGVKFAKSPTEIELMQHMRASTAERWLAHWLAGGSVESIHHKSDEDTIIVRRAAADKRLDEGALLRRWIRRARRGRIKPID